MFSSEREDMLWFLSAEHVSTVLKLHMLLSRCVTAFKVLSCFINASRILFFFDSWGQTLRAYKAFSIFYGSIFDFSCHIYKDLLEQKSGINFPFSVTEIKITKYSNCLLFFKLINVTLYRLNISVYWKYYSSANQIFFPIRKFSCYKSRMCLYRYNILGEGSGDRCSSPNWL